MRILLQIALLFNDLSLSYAQALPAQQNQLSANIGIAYQLADKGLILLDHRATPVVQIQGTHQSGLFGALRMDKADISGLYTSTSNEEWQNNIAIGYVTPINHRWSVSGNHSWYKYSHAKRSDRKHDYREWQFGIHLDNQWSFNAGYNEAMWGYDASRSFATLNFLHPVSRKILLEAELGWIKTRYSTVAEYGFFRFSSGIVHGDWSASCHLHYSSENARVRYQEDRTGASISLLMNYHF